MLTGSQICDCVKTGKILISPFSPSNVNPNSYDISIDLKSLKTSKNGAFFDYKKNNDDQFENVELDKEGAAVLYPSRLYLAKTVEYTDTPKLVPLIVGRSSLARLGVSIHQTAGFGDIGFKGYWTLELTVTNPTRLYHGQRVGQIFYFKPDESLIATSYRGKYYNNNGVQCSRSYLDREFAQ